MSSDQSKDTVQFVTRENLSAAAPSGATSPPTAAHQADVDEWADRETSQPALDTPTESEKPPQAYDPETGEINWDCPCLGGMATEGPCAEAFRDSFSCFVYSKTDPQGMDCVDKFMAMQECFAAHPEHYSDLVEAEKEAAAKGEDEDDDEDDIDDVFEPEVPVPSRPS